LLQPGHHRRKDGYPVRGKTGERQTQSTKEAIPKPLTTYFAPETSYSPHLLVAGVLDPALAEVGDVGARYDTIRRLIDLLAAPPAAVRAAVGIKEPLESVRYVQYPTPGVAHVCTIQDTKRRGVLHM
jgi:hypothetical protein